MQKTKIEWCDMTWNPVTGCLHNCEYCYARKIAKRFGTHCDYLGCDESGEPMMRVNRDFQPSIHKNRFDEPQYIKKPQNVFVCSMADLFGEWVPDEWIQKVFKTCEKAPQHRYLFLTKNPKRFYELLKYDLLPKNNNFWYGSTITNIGTGIAFGHEEYNHFTSIEPILSSFDNIAVGHKQKWIIIGAETGNRKSKITPKREWIEYIVKSCRFYNVSIFLKDNLATVWGEPLIQEYPWKMKKNAGGEV